MIARFSHISIFIIIVLVTVSLIGLVFVQIKWIKSAFLVNEQKFNDRVCNAVTAVEEMYGTNLSAYFPVSNDLKNSDQPLKKILNKEFGQRSLPTDFSLAVYDHQKRKILGDLKPEDWESSLTQPFACSYLIAIYFPGKQGVLLSEMSETLAPSILFISLIISSFAYVIWTLNKQKKLSEIKNDFINNLTHEFKTPLSSISLTNKVFRERNPQRFDEKDVSYFQIIEKESGRLKSHIDKILQMAQIDAGVFTLEKQEIDIHSIINKVVQSFDPILNEVGGKIFLSLNAERPVTQGDETHITNMIYNLVDNACKYSHCSPKILITTGNTEEGLCISVKDNGIGINKETQKHIFDKFYRAQTGNVHTVKGFGLGLSYVKSIALAHRGRINLKSEIDKGSDFEVILPLI